MNRGNKSLYSALTSISMNFVNGLLGLVVTRLIISKYGSDFNGLNSTANQLVNMLLILEGGFTLATNVALFKPLSEQNYTNVNKIMSATKRTFTKIGGLFLVIGIVGSFGYSMIIKSALPKDIVIMVFIMTVIPAGFNLIYATKYRILLQTEQREYILNIVQTATIIIAQTLSIGVILLQENMLLVRFVTMLGAIINCLIVGYICNKRYEYLSFKEVPNYTAIKGTKDVFVQKITSMIYSTLPIIFISVTSGTLTASVYAVYNSIFMLLKNILLSFINAPRMGFGQLFTEKDKKYVFNIFIQYEYIVINAMVLFLSTATVLMMSFIKLYTHGISDIDYENWYIAGLLIGITFFEVIHIPSGNIIDVSGKFKISKYIQLIACIVLVISMFFGGSLFGFQGIIGAVFITSILLAFMEILYVHIIFFENSVIPFLKLLLSNVTVITVVIIIEFLLVPSINTYLQFIITACILMIINASLILLFNLIFNKHITIQVLNRLKMLGGMILNKVFKEKFVSQ